MGALGVIRDKSGGPAFSSTFISFSPPITVSLLLSSEATISCGGLEILTNWLGFLLPDGRLDRPKDDNRWDGEGWTGRSRRVGEDEREGDGVDWEAPILVLGPSGNSVR